MSWNQHTTFFTLEGAPDYKTHRCWIVHISFFYISTALDYKTLCEKCFIITFHKVIISHTLTPPPPSNLREGLRGVFPTFLRTPLRSSWPQYLFSSAVNVRLLLSIWCWICRTETKTVSELCRVFFWVTVKSLSWDSCVSPGVRSHLRSSSHLTCCCALLLSFLCISDSVKFIYSSEWNKQELIPLKQ